MADVLVGLDLGQLTDHTALAVMARSLAINEKTGLPVRTSRGRPCHRFDVMALKRFQLGTSYASIVAHVTDLMLRSELGDYPRLIVDATGVGVPIVEMFRAALAPHPRVEVHAVSITAGRAVSTVAKHTYHVAKLELVAAIREVLETRRLKLARKPDGTAIDHADVLKHELLNFRVKITASANETFSAREGMHDDLCLAVGLPCWFATMPQAEMVTDEEDGVRLRWRESAAIASERSMLADLEKSEREAIELERSKAAEREEQERRRPSWAARIRKPEELPDDPWNDKYWS